MLESVRWFATRVMRRQQLGEVAADDEDSVSMEIQLQQEVHAGLKLSRESGWMRGSSCSPRCGPLHNKEAAAINDTTSAVELITNLADNQGLLSLVRWLKHKLLEHCGVANCVEDEMLKSIAGHKEFDWANGATFVRHMLKKQAIPYWEHGIGQILEESRSVNMAAPILEATTYWLRVKTNALSLLWEGEQWCILLTLVHCT
ncbi:hypothetical protein SELMODRAFT_416786 [Selaginella moellendorffii]|uniref:Uncharacterized protein n=1 Tax=Selaginella moellendorffii TaxID=88036 RepID=D8S0E8_SELML|nr:hypothetical protein SELMODRAFT_416786 [Selaginella moellendorffii]